MPIEIKELHIRIAVTSPDSSRQTGGGSAAVGSGTAGDGNDKDVIVAECVEQILQILQRKAER